MSALSSASATAEKVAVSLTTFSAAMAARCSESRSFARAHAATARLSLSLSQREHSQPQTLHARMATAQASSTVCGDAATCLRADLRQHRGRERAACAPSDAHFLSNHCPSAAASAGLRYSSHTARSGLGLARVVRLFVWPRHANSIVFNDATRSLRV